MTNLEYMVKLMSDENHDPFDDGGAAWEAMVHYYIKCPRYVGDLRAKCHGDISMPSRELCVECKLAWLGEEVAE